MKFYLAPMEAVTGYVYRNVYHALQDDMDTYFTPFISPNQTKKMRTREKKDIAPENNAGMYVIPQILTNRADYFIQACDMLKELGYTQVNLNLGCPSKTVVSKHKGAGFLEEPKALEQFFGQIFPELEKRQMKLSVKTRIGMEYVAEWEDLLQVYAQFPFTEVIVHPRLQIEYYKEHPHLDAVAAALAQLSCPVCYNGDIFKAEHYHRLREQFPQIDRVMLGRGILSNPFLIAEIKGTGKRTREGLYEYHNRLFQAYREELSSDRDALFKMKELWFYLAFQFQDAQSELKKVKKAVKAEMYQAAVSHLFANCELKNE